MKAWMTTCVLRRADEGKDLLHTLQEWEDDRPPPLQPASRWALSRPDRKNPRPHPSPDNSSIGYRIIIS